MVANNSGKHRSNQGVDRRSVKFCIEYVPLWANGNAHFRWLTSPLVTERDLVRVRTRVSFLFAIF